MNSYPDRSVEELRRESERSRAELAVTVHQLRQKVGETTSELKTMVSPAHIKSEVRSYIREERDSVMSSLEQKARDNPLQAAAIGAAVAYPLLGLLRAIPTPLLLVGAGLFLTTKRGKRAMADVKDQAAGVYEEGAARASEYASSIQTELSERTAGVRKSAEDFAAAASSRVSESLHQAGDAAASLRDTVSESLHDARDATSHGVSSLAGSATEQAGRIRAGARTSGNAVADFVTQNPLLVAGLGAAAGAFIAAAIPSSNAENKMFGAASSGLKRKARDAAAGGLDQAKQAAAGVAANVAMAAAREGLNEEGLRKAADNVVEGVKAVAERGLSAALSGLDDSEPPNRQQNPQNTARNSGANQ